MRVIHTHINIDAAFLDDVWNEADHPRDDIGRFSAGQGTAEEHKRASKAHEAQARKHAKQEGPEHNAAKRAHETAADTHKIVSNKWTSSSSQEFKAWAEGESRKAIAASEKAGLFAEIKAGAKSPSSKSSAPAKAPMVDPIKAAQTEDLTRSASKSATRTRAGMSMAGLKLSRYDADALQEGRWDEHDTSGLVDSLHDQLARNMVQAKTAEVHPSRMLATQRWIRRGAALKEAMERSQEHIEHIFPTLADKPVGARDPEGFIHILDGHHRISDSVLSNPNKPVQMHVLPWPWKD